jgi:serine phosphatase RsbU (regulator of sigma subunit)
MTTRHKRGSWLRRLFPQRSRQTMTEILSTDSPQISRERFEHLLMKAHTLGKVGSLPADYVHGFKRGLRRLFHGASFGTAAEHMHWLAMTDARGQGYQDGLHGREPTA